MKRKTTRPALVSNQRSPFRDTELLYASYKISCTNINNNSNSNARRSSTILQKREIRNEKLETIKHIAKIEEYSHSNENLLRIRFS